jgi:hypothetical protein
MSWQKEQYRDAYNRTTDRDTDDYNTYNEIYGYWDDCDDYDRTYDRDGQAPTMKDIMMGRLFNMLAKLRIRGSKTILDNIYW